MTRDEPDRHFSDPAGPDPDRMSGPDPGPVRVRPDRIPDCPVRLKNPAGPDRIHGKIDKKKKMGVKKSPFTKFTYLYFFEDISK